jgi:hypothetical protein
MAGLWHFWDEFFEKFCLGIYFSQAEFPKIRLGTALDKHGFIEHAFFTEKKDGNINPDSFGMKFCPVHFHKRDNPNLNYKSGFCLRFSENALRAPAAAATTGTGLSK